MKLYLYHITLFLPIIQLLACKDSITKTSTKATTTKKNSAAIITNKKTVFDTLNAFIMIRTNGCSNRIDFYFKRNISSTQDATNADLDYLDNLTKSNSDLPHETIGDIASYIQFSKLLPSPIPDSVKNIDVSKIIIQYVVDKKKNNIGLADGITVTDINEDGIQDLLFYQTTEGSTTKNPLFDVWLGTKNGKYQHKADFFRGAFYGYSKYNSHLLITGLDVGDGSNVLDWNMVKNDTLQPLMGRKIYDNKMAVSEIYTFRNGKKTTRYFKDEILYNKELKRLKMDE